MGRGVAHCSFLISPASPGSSHGFLRPILVILCRPVCRSGVCPGLKPLGLGLSHIPSALHTHLALDVNLLCFFLCQCLAAFFLGGYLWWIFCPPMSWNFVWLPSSLCGPFCGSFCVAFFLTTFALKPWAQGEGNGRGEGKRCQAHFAFTSWKRL